MDNLYDINISGIGKINKGSYKDITMSGITTILGSINGEDINIEGLCKSHGDINCNKFFSEGTLTSNGSIDASNTIYLSGLINIEGNLQGKEITSSGKLTVTGLMSGDNIIISMSSTNKIREIGGEKVCVELLKKSIFSDPKLITDSIEADNITLENTICDVVRGNFLTIKSGCTIKKVEYTGELIIDSNSNISEIVKF